MYSQNKKRLTVRRAAEADARGQRVQDKDTALRRLLSASSLGREKVRATSSPDPSPAHRYKQDSEAYKHRGSPKAAIMIILKSGNSVDGHKVT